MIDMNLKQKCHILRQQGKSYNFISHETGISKSTLSYWFSGKELSEGVKVVNQEANRQASRDRLIAYLKVRNQGLRQKEFATLLEAQKDFEKFKKQPLFMAGLMLYAGEGDKAHRQMVRLSNADPLLCLVFVRFIRKYFPAISDDKMKLWILAYPDHDAGIVEAHWLKIMGFERKNLYKTQVAKGRNKTKRLPYGVGNVSISNRLAKVRILELLRLGIRVLIQ
jgi:hypothetical protein